MYAFCYIRQHPSFVEPVYDSSYLADVEEVSAKEETTDDLLFETVDEEEVLSTNALVVHVVDGDTIDILIDGQNEKMRVRMLGINTPETVDPRKPVQCFGKEASAFLKELLLNKRVLVESDPAADERDKYGRLLRNVYLSDGTDINAYLIEHGYAYAYTSFPLAQERKMELIALENQAKEASLGLWSSCED